VFRWSRIGRTGRLGGLGVVSAIGLGLACATTQLVWFLVPFLVVGLLLLRLGDRSGSAAWWITIKYGLVVLAVFAVVNLPFAIWNFHVWRVAMTTPLVAQTIPHGQGIIGITLNVINGSGAMNFFSYATAALAIGLLICYAVFIRKLGPAMVILPWGIFFLSIRASDKYFYLMAPIWVISVATVRHRDFATAWAPRLRIGPWAVLARWPARVAIITLCLAPAVALSVVAMATPQPLAMTGLVVTPSKSSYTKEIRVVVTNRSTQTIAPHFALSNSVGLTRFWTVVSGPTSVTAGQVATYNLLPPQPSARKSLLGAHIELRAMSANPETMSSIALPMLTASP
jgi:hypothetical protein